VVKTAALGDVLRTTAFLPALRRAGYGPVVWLSSPGGTQLLRGNPHLDRVAVWRGGSAAVLKDVPWSLVLSLEEDTQLATLVSSLSAKRLFGIFQDGHGEVVYTSDSRGWFDLSLVSRFGRDRADALKALNRKTYPDLVLRGLGLDRAAAAPSLQLEARERAAGRALAKRLLPRARRPLIGLATGAGRRWQGKSLGLARAAELAAAIEGATGGAVLVLGGGEERERNRELVAAARRAGAAVANAGTRHGLRRYAALLAALDAVVTSDSLTLHLATALGVPAVAFFGPTSAAEIATYDRVVKLTPPAACSCFYQPRCRLAERCVDTIPVASFTAALASLLARRAR